MPDIFYYLNDQTKRHRRYLSHSKFQRTLITLLLLLDLGIMI
jgi:hypothetical protein